MTGHRFTRRALVAALSAAPLPALARNVLPAKVEVLGRRRRRRASASDASSKN